MKKALAMAGGGTRGAYQAGAIKALIEMGRDDWNIVTGTSVGALNACLVVQKDYDKLFALYDNLSVDMILNGMSPADMNLRTIFNERDAFIKELRKYVKDQGLDISPFLSRVHELYNPDRFFSSPIDFGCIAATAKGHEGVYVTKDMMKEHGEDWLVATASAYPAFPMRNIDGTDYVDGGYFDNCPIDFALRLGADEVLVMDLNHSPNHPGYVGRANIRYMFPKSETGDFLDFSRERLNRLFTLGYNDAGKMFDRYKGYKYTFTLYHRPHFFDRWYVNVELLEARIKQAGMINDRLRSDTFITDTLKSSMQLPYLKPQNYFEGMMDFLLDLIQAEETKVYTLKEARNLIFASFADCAKEDFSYKPSGFSQLGTMLDQKETIARLLHADFYPDHVFANENTVLTLYPFEKAAADFIYMWMKEFSQE